MEAKTITLQWVGPTEEVHSIGPRPLEYHDRQGKQHFFDPEVDEKGLVSYVVTEEYGRRLLGGQPDRFYLLSPDKLTVKKKLPGGMKTEHITVHSIRLPGGARVKQPMRIKHPEPPVKTVPTVPIRTEKTAPPPAANPPVAEETVSEITPAPGATAPTHDLGNFPSPQATAGKKPGGKPPVTAE